jgi:hypothetical protein
LAKHLTLTHAEFLKRRFQLDDDLLEDLKEDLIYAKKLAVDEEGRVLVWTGGIPAHATPGTSARRGGKNVSHARNVRRQTEW